jgi:hypothetical protein
VAVGTGEDLGVDVGEVVGVGVGDVFEFSVLEEGLNAM